MNKLLFVAGFSLLALGAGCQPQTPITSFRDCVDRGGTVMESYPRQCKYGSVTVTEQIGNALEKADLITIDSPRPNDIVTTPLTIRGEARGTWYFEATFPVKIVDSDGNVLGQSYAQAQDEWMTEEFVPFESTLTFDPGDATEGVLVLEKDNPSGLPENDDQLRIPVYFK